MAFGSNLTSGSIIVGAIGWNTATTLNSITAASGCTGLSVTLVDNPTQATFLTAGFYITGYAAGACTLQFNFSGSNGEVSYGAHEVSGQATSTPVGTRHKAMSFSNAGPSAVETTASVATSGTDYQFIGYTELNNNQVASAAGSGYTIRESFTGGGGGSVTTADKSTSGTVTGSFTTAASTANYGSVVLIDVAPAAGGATRGLFQFPPLSGLGIGGSFFRDPLQYVGLAGWAFALIAACLVATQQSVGAVERLYAHWTAARAAQAAMAAQDAKLRTLMTDAQIQAKQRERVRVRRG